ncbi:syncoilin [Aplochiton taeniatus]
MEQLDMAAVCVDFKVDLGTLDAQIAHLNELGSYEGTPTRGHTQETRADMEPVPEGFPHSEGTEAELGVLGSQLEVCIEEVERLQRRREQLLEEVLELRGEKGVGGEAERSTEEGVAELMGTLVREADGRREERLRAVQTLWGEKREEERKTWKVRLERQGLQDETRRLKRRLFAVAKECAHSQITLATQQLQVEQLQKEQETLQSLEAKLTEEGTQLRSTHQQQLASLRVHRRAQGSSQTTSTQEELTQCRRHSCGDIQQYLQSSVKAMEERYEPMLLALLKRREATAEGLVKAREQAQELRVQLGPLREESQKLELHRACLEEKLRLKDSQRREDVAQYKETVFRLEEDSRELKTELQIQKRRTIEMEEQKDSLTQQLNLYKGLIEKNNKCGDIEETT